MKKLQNGRSMVEMLGVLAIIGVLSVGAIAGYQKAMFKYKLNKQTQQISHLVNIMHIYKRHWYELGKNGKFVNLIPYYIKLGELPKEMIKNSDDVIYDTFNTEIKASTNGCIAPSPCNGTAIYLILNSKVAPQICQNLFNIAQEFDQQLSYVQVNHIKANNDNTSMDSTFYGSKYTYSTHKSIKDITLEQIYNACTSCDDDAKRCNFVYNFLF